MSNTEKHVIAIGNHKGGVGKTTTAFYLGCGMAKTGYKVLYAFLNQVIQDLNNF